MIIEKFLFPAPNPSNYTLTSHDDHLIWLPTEHGSFDIPKIPCMIYSPPRQANFFMIFSHGNGCDIGTMDTFMKILSDELNTHILIFEYPSYGLCQGSVDINKTTVNNHAERAYSFVHETLHWPTDKILMYGHSIGTGPACHIASTKPIGGLILQSPYTSIQNVITGLIGFPGYLFGNSYWNNLETMKYINCPTLFIHGERDGLIPSEHSKTLYNSLGHIENKQIILLPDDDHNSISYTMSSSCVKSFLKQIFPPSNQLLPEINIDPEFQVPPETKQTSSSIFSYNPFTSLFNLSTVSINATQSVYNSMFSNQYNNQ
ncbi:unnamed protein product [Rotaria sp. Silwood2]|nr:unnamed protein product [Rotaria sp. Silwood2]